MKIVSAVGNKVVLEHVNRRGRAINLEVNVDNDGKSFIKSNINNIVYDVTNDVLKVGSTTLVRAYAMNKHGNLPSNRKIMFKDGNKYNLRNGNLYILN